MSSLVFVRDAHGRPLMPMSAAYARTLIHQGKAHVWPHPAVSVIQLTHAVATPTLRPVLVGIALSRYIADLVIVVEQMRGSPSTIHIAVDLQFPPPLRRGQQNRWESRRRRIPFTHEGALPRSADRVRMLTCVMQILRAIIPISHLIFLPSARRTALTPPHAGWFEHRLAAHVRQLSGTITVVHQHTRLSGESPRVLTRHLIERVVWAARESPQLVAAIRPHGNFHRQNHRWWKQRMSPLLRSIPVSDLSSLGQLCTVRHQRCMITGMLYAHELPDHLLLKVPVQVDNHGVEWQLKPIPSIPSLHVWPSTPIWLLPLMSMSRGARDEG